MHTAADNRIDWEHAFGPGLKNFPTQWLAEAGTYQLSELRPSHLGERRSAGSVIGILLDEQIHRGAEIALLRDLYPHR